MEILRCDFFAAKRNLTQKTAKSKNNFKIFLLRKFPHAHARALFAAWARAKIDARRRVRRL